MDDPTTKSEFLTTMQAERLQWETLLAEVAEAQMLEPGISGSWSVKDIVAHVTAYEQGLVEWLNAARHGEAVTFSANPDHPDLDYRNALIFTQNHKRSLPEVLAESTCVFQELFQQIEALSAEELFDAQHTAWFVVKPRWGHSRPVWMCIADDSYRHYRQHIPDIRVWLKQQG